MRFGLLFSVIMTASFLSSPAAQAADGRMKVLQVGPHGAPAIGRDPVQILRVVGDAYNTDRRMNGEKILAVLVMNGRQVAAVLEPSGNADHRIRVTRFDGTIDASRVYRSWGPPLLSGEENGRKNFFLPWGGVLVVKPPTHRTAAPPVEPYTAPWLHTETTVGGFRCVISPNGDMTLDANAAEARALLAALAEMEPEQYVLAPAPGETLVSTAGASATPSPCLIGTVKGFKLYAERP